MKAIKLYGEKLVYADGAIREEVVWCVPAPLPPSEHAFKYRLACAVNGVRIIGYNNERGKGDHIHCHGTETRYVFRGPIDVIEDFRAEVRKERSK